MAKGIDEWAATLETRLEEIQAPPPPPADDFSLYVNHRVVQLGHEVYNLAAFRPTDPRTVAEFQAASPVIERYVEHAAILKFLGNRGLQDEYWGQWQDTEDFRGGVTSFVHPTTGQPVNWRFAVTDRKFPEGPMRYLFYHQEGDEEGSWSYKMKVIASL